MKHTVIQESKGASGMDWFRSGAFSLLFQPIPYNNSCCPGSIKGAMDPGEGGGEPTYCQCQTGDSSFSSPLATAAARGAASCKVAAIDPTECSLEQLGRWVADCTAACCLSLFISPFFAL